LNDKSIFGLGLFFHDGFGFYRHNGCGNEPQDLEQIFFPFYATKHGRSGIGLSISQQIMHKQKENIRVRSVPGTGTVFTLSFLC
jgi:two-component system nitrogen regulation sensor histidine kinase NtrY